MCSETCSQGESKLRGSGFIHEGEDNPKGETRSNNNQVSVPHGLGASAPAALGSETCTL